MLTFVVYYRIHLNLNLEASARQWPNNKPHQFEVGVGGDPTLKPYTLMGFLSSWVHKRFLNMNKSFLKAGTPDLSGSAPFPMNQTDFEGSLNVLEHFYPKRGLLIVVLMVFFEKAKNQTVCPYLWEILDTVTVNTKLGLRPVHKVTLANNTIYSFFGSMYQRSVHVHKSGLNSSGWRKWHKFACTTVFLGWTSPPVQTIAISRHAHRQIYTYNCNIYVYRWIYILAIHAHLNWIILDWRPQLYTE